MNGYDLFMAPLEKKFIREIRKKIIPKAVGDVLEIGAGTGANFPFYQQDKISSFHVLDIEIKQIAKARAPKNTVFKQSDTARLPYDDESFDTVVESLVLCSVDDERTMMREIVRVIKPGGRFIHIDHGLPDERKLKKLFRIIAPAWRGMTKSCRIDKDHQAIIEASGLDMIEKHSKGKGVFYWGVSKKQSID
jgi:ubiquinone/menaquinone biosynthesis C-methylase UbiE